MAKIIRVEVHGSAVAAEAAKQVMVASLGYKAGDVTITDSSRVKLISQAVSVVTELTFEDPSDNQLHVVMGTK